MKADIGNVIYYLKMQSYESIRYGKYRISFGIIEERYPGVAVIQLYEPPDLRTINGIPIKEFKTPSKWEKLPKGWTYNTKLFDLGWLDVPEEWKNFHIDKPEEIKAAIDCGALVKVSDKDYAHIETEIDKRNGWRIIRTYPTGEYHPSFTTLNVSEIYDSYEEAKEKLNQIEAEYKRQVALSNYEWSVEQIDHNLDRWAKIYGIPDTIKNKTRDFILSMKDVEDIETRISEGGIQWKYSTNKRWKNIE